MVSKAVKEVTDVPKIDESLLSAVDGLLISEVNGFDLETHQETRPVEPVFGAHCDAVSHLDENSKTPAIANVGIDSRSVAKAAVAGGLVFTPGVGPFRQVLKPQLPLRLLSVRCPQKSIPVPKSYDANPLF